MSIMSKMNFDIKEDKLLWDGLVTININENLDFTTKPSYSTHIVRLYRNSYNSLYYVFAHIEPDLIMADYSVWEFTDESKFDCGWGKFIMNYNKHEYELLKEYIPLNDNIIIFGATIKYGEKIDDLKDNNFYIVDPKYRDI